MSHQRPEVFFVQSQKDIRGSCRAEKDRAILGRNRYDRPVKYQLVPDSDKLGLNSLPFRYRCVLQGRHVMIGFPDAICTAQQVPALLGGQSEDRLRSSLSASASRHQNAAVEKQPQRAARNRCMSSSSSRIHPAICSREKVRGSGIGAPWERSRSSKNRKSSLCSSRARDPAAFSTSVRRLIS